MPDLAKYVGLDVGGTTMKAAVVDANGTPFPHVTLPTNPERGQDAGLETMCEAVRQAVAAAKLTLADITAVGVATPGLMDIKLGLILDPPNLKPWRNVEVPKFLGGKLGKPIAFQNDANAAALGEFCVGAGKDVDSFVLFTLGTGIGGGIVVDGKVLEGAHSHGGEIGHMRIALPDTGRLCGCGRRGCLEAYASGTAVLARTREEVPAYRGPTRLRGLLAKKGEDLEAKDIFLAAAEGDPVARKVVEDTAYYLALGACSIMATVDPQMIAYGGGMIAAGESFLNTVQEYVGRFGLSYPASKVQIRYAQLGSDAGFIGAAMGAKSLAKG
ncbi:MAG TPA: ROK family protein [Fimbriiglobus sp.]|jgi:glucokinase